MATVLAQSEVSAHLGVEEPDLTVVYYTANTIPEHFAKHTQKQLLLAIGNLPLIVVSKKPMDLGELSENIVCDTPRSHVNIYKQAFIGVEAAQTKYIALAEDDILYSPEHFKFRPKPGKFAYNLSYWGIYTWTEPVFSFKGRKNLWSLICERELFLEAMTERFMKYPNDADIDPNIFGEPGKYENKLGVTPRETEDFWTHPANIMFSHESAISFEGLGKRKALGKLRATALPYWGRAEVIQGMYNARPE